MLFATREPEGNPSVKKKKYLYQFFSLHAFWTAGITYSEPSKVCCDSLKQNKIKMYCDREERERNLLY
jgi:hypothetical protein